MHTPQQAKLPLAAPRTFLIAGREVILDECDAHLISGVRWTIKKSVRTCYVQRNLYAEHHRYIGYESLHRLITNCPQGLAVDHVNGNGLDNRRANLRVCTAQQNQWNRRRNSNNKSGFKGVYADKYRGRIMWRAEISARGKRLRVGRFDSPAEAHQAYKSAAKRLHGEFSRVT